MIAATDPGVRNWLDTAGLHEGEFLIRWQDLPADEAATAVREVNLVKIAELAAPLPKATQVTAEQRREMANQRAKSYANRIEPVQGE